MSRMKCYLVLLAVAAFSANSFNLLAQDSITQPKLKPPFAASLGAALADQPASEAAKFKFPKDKTVTTFADLVVELSAPCTGDCPTDCCATCADSCDVSSDELSDQCSCNSSCNDGTCCIQSAGNHVDCCDGCDLAVCGSLATEQNDDPIQKYCRQMAALLAVSLRTSSASEDGDRSVELQQKAIEAAMLMVAETAEANSHVKIAELEATHQETVSSLQVQINQLSAGATSVSQLREWLGPIYTNQNRNYQQMQLVSANNATMNRTLSLLEKQIERANEKQQSQTIRNHTIAKADYITSVPVNSMPANNANRQYAQAQNVNADEIKRLKSQILELQSRLEKLHSDSVQRAGHLEPVFTPDQPLKPIMNR